MKNFLKLRNISLFIFGSLLIFLYVLFYDAFPRVKRFRTMQDIITTSEGIDLRGLREIKASGGSLPGFPDLQKKLSYIKDKKIIVDAMYDFHGYILGMPSTSLAYHQEAPLLKHFLRRFLLTWTFGKRLGFITPESVEAKKYGFDYRAVNVGSKISNTYDYIDDVVAFFDSLSPDVWLHFHCRNGRGRTSMLLVMYDIMKNAPQVTLNDIVKRHILLGAEDLFDTKVWENGTYTAKALQDRKEFIEQFYDFASQRKAGGIQRWSDWHKANLKEKA